MEADTHIDWKKETFEIKEKLETPDFEIEEERQQCDWNEAKQEVIRINLLREEKWRHLQNIVIYKNDDDKIKALARWPEKEDSCYGGPTLKKKWDSIYFLYLD